MVQNKITRANQKYLRTFFWLTCFLSLNYSGYAQPSATQNYVITNTVKQSRITNETMVNALPIASQGKTQSISYFDGLGRPLENVVTQGSATQHDIITGFEYDAYGREITKYLPYSDINNTITPGGYRPAWKTAQSSFYSTGNMTNVDPSTAPYSVADIEPSPLGRILAQGAPGTIWQPNLTNPYDPASHSVQYHYLINKADDNVRIFLVDSLGNISTPGYYASGLIKIKTTTDEQQQTVKEFTDKSGHTVLKRVMIAGDSIQTYYIYDRLDMLRAIIQPEGTSQLQAAGWVFPGGFSAKWMFLYRYDARRRVVMKKLPGADSLNMLYDQWDRLVLSQDGNQRVSHFWIFNKYDQFNRIVVTGQITDSRSLSALQMDVTNSSGRFELVNTSATEGYTLNTTFPSSSVYSLTVYTTKHFDSYLNLPSWASGYSFVNENGINSQNNYVIGQVISTQTRIIGSSTFLRSEIYFDDKYRIIQSTEDNAAGGKDRITKIAAFDGKIINDYRSHLSRFFTTAHFTKQSYVYDHFDRLNIVTHQTGTQEPIIINQSVFNELGKILNKKLHQSVSHPSPLQTVDYYYNIRGWLIGINRPLFAESGHDDADFFNLELHYTNTVIPGAMPQYNGNIAEEIYKPAYGEGEMGNKYLYDQANRLTSSAWGYPWGNGNPGWTLTKRFDESGISFDHNGNILTLTRYFGDYSKIDSLKYGNYNGNQLGKVDDLAPVNTVVGFQDKSNAGGNDYNYDANGNLVSDYNKSISSISYNYLNLPSVISITGKGTITYLYDASGNKLQKTIYETAPNKTTNYYYAGDYVYRNDTLEFISHMEGRLRPVRMDTTQAISIANLKYIYDYYLKDHLGTVRCVLTTEEQTDLYAATMETANATKENSLFANISSTAIAKPAGFSADNSNQMVSKLNGDGVAGDKRVGPSITLKVMAGDTISISSYSWYTGAVQPPPTNATSLLNELFPLIQAGLAGQNGSKGGAIPSSYTDPALTTDVTNFLSGSRPYDNLRPKAFLNWIVVGEDYVAATGEPNHVNAIQIPNCNAGDSLKQTVGLNRLVVRRNGWIYIYLSNESAQNVYFDNLVINLTHGPLVEQKDYYPFGMENPALSTRAIKPSYVENRQKFNEASELQNKEFIDGTGLEDYDFNARTYDPQLGRFLQPDPLADIMEELSLYVYANNNPSLINDPTGLDTGLAPVYVVGYLPAKPKPSPDVAGSVGTAPTNVPAPIPPPPAPDNTEAKGGPVFYEPEPVIDIKIVPEVATGSGVLGIISRALGTFGLLLIPESAPGEGPNWKPFTGHGNRNDNSNPHIVYEFTFTPPPGDKRTPVLKYGISDEHRYGLDRPENQMPGFKLKYGNSVQLKIYMRTPDRETAKMIEQQLVNNHFEAWQSMPREQTKPPYSP